MTAAGLGAMLTIQLRSGWKALATWVVALGGTMLATTTSISGLYDTPAKMRSYAQAVHSGDALVAVNGRVAGVDTLGGIVANEFGFVAALAIPLMAISLVARWTRKDEERGRLEMLLAGRVSRGTPLASALVLTTGALALTSAVFVAALAVAGVPGAPSVLYAASMGALGLTFAAVAAVAAQLVEHARGVYAVGLGTLVVSYLVRGVGDVSVGPLTWLSPLGWQERTRAFGDARWWPLVVPVAVALVLAFVAVVENGRRDLGSAVLRRGGSAPVASPVLRTTLGTAARLHRGSVVGWGLGSLVVASTFGALSQPLVDAVEGNPDIAQAMGAAGASGLDAVLTTSALLVALLAGGYAVQAAGVVRAEETTGRLEAALAGARHRVTWLGAQLLVLALGVVVVVGVGALALALSSAWSTGEPTAQPVTRAMAAYLPAVAVVGAFAVLAFGTAPRLQPLAWLVFAAAALVAYLGDALGLGEGVQDLSPFHWVGRPPQLPADRTALVSLSALSILFVVGAFVGFRRRDVPLG